jgi:hypothetical protein
MNLRLNVPVENIWLAGNQLITAWKKLVGDNE